MKATLQLGARPLTAKTLAASLAVHALGIGAAVWFCVGGMARVAWRPQSASPFLTAIVEPEENCPSVPDPEAAPAVEPEPSEVQIELAPDVEIDRPDVGFEPPTTAAVDPAPPPAARAHADAWAFRLRRTARPAAATQPAEAAPAAEIEPSPLPGQNPAPTYPWVPWRRGIEGTVVLRLEIDAKGAVTAAEIVRSSGNGELDREALRCLRTWHFEPARDAAGPHATAILKDVVFRLTN
ncbi:MAG: TonB family protein [Planctomycetota bacterium]